MEAPRRVVLWLALAETIVWAGFFYAFPALLAAWERDLGWSKLELSGAFTGALIVSALCAPAAGALIDRGRSRLVLFGGTMLGGALLVALSQIQALWQFYLVWLAMGVAFAGALYEPCFAHITRLFGRDAKRAVTVVALVAGLAGTLAFPAAHVLVASMGWRAGTLVFAMAVFLLAAPMMWSATPPSRPGASAPPLHASGSGPGSALSRILAMPVFWLMAIAYASIALDHGLLLTHLLPLLDERGVHPQAAVLAAAMIGPMQVAGRLLMMAMDRHVSIAVVLALSYVLMAAAALALFGARASPALLAGFVLFHGAGYGVTSIARPLATAHLLGTAGFGAISGALAVAFLGTFAGAPTIAALLWQVGGYDLVIIAAFAASLLGLACFAAALRLAARAARRAG